MSFLGSILGLLTVGESMVEARLMRRFIVGIAIGLGLVVLSSMMTGILIVGLFYLLFQLMVSYGMEEHAALIATGLLGVLSTAGVVTATALWFRHLLKTPNPFTAMRNPIDKFLHQGVIGAFVEGFSASASRKPKPGKAAEKPGLKPVTVKGAAANVNMKTQRRI
ncbi:hypothetical protein GC177_08740 [bacterium]|nr:hypothetical protein [bacterium]